MYSELLHVSANHVAKNVSNFALYKITDIFIFF